MHWDKHTLELLERFKTSMSFQEAVLAFRKRVGIPVTGFTKHSEEFDFMDEGNSEYEFRQSEYEKLIDLVESKEELTHSVRMAIHHYIFLGDNTEIDGFDTGFFYYNCSILPDKDGFAVKIYPGAKKNDIISAIKGEWEFIDTVMRAAHPEKYKISRIKKKTARSSDKVWYELYKAKGVDMHGALNYSVCVKFLKSKNITAAENFLSIKAGFKKLKLNLTSSVYTRRNSVLRAISEIEKEL